MKKTLLVLFCFVSHLSFSQLGIMPSEKTLLKPGCGTGAVAAAEKPRVIVRCGAGVTAANEPLIVVDGVALAKGRLSAIDPNEIESISILKSSEAAALYGSQAANGVILIRTKQHQLTLVDESDGTPVGSATVELYSGTERRVYFSSKEGLVTVPLWVALKADSVNISCIGYAALRTKFSRDNATLRLKQKVAQMEPVSVSSTSRWITCRLCCGLRVTRIQNVLLPEKAVGSSSYSIYPNPVARGGTITVRTGEPSAQTYAVLNMAGQVVQTGNITALKSFTIAVGNWPAGNYLLQLHSKTSEQSISQKIIIY